jgi:Large polyvalent protein associated domain 38
MAWKPPKEWEQYFGKPQSSQRIYKTTGTQYTRGDYKNMSYYDNSLKATAQHHAKETGLDSRFLENALKGYIRDKAIASNDNNKQIEKNREGLEKARRSVAQKDWNSISKQIKKGKDDKGKFIDDEAKKLDKQVKEFTAKSGRSVTDNPITRYDLKQFQKLQEVLAGGQKAVDKAKGKKTEKKDKKKDDGGLWGDIKKTSKTFGQFVNPFDDVTMKEALKKESTKKRSESSKTLNKYVSAKKAADIASKPGDALRSGLDTKAKGGSFYKGFADGLTGKREVSGKELNKALGFDPANDKKDAQFANLFGKKITSSLPNQFISDSNSNTKLGESALGFGSELVVDPLNLIGTGLLGKAAGKTTKVASKIPSKITNEIPKIVEPVEKTVSTPSNIEELIDTLKSPKKEIAPTAEKLFKNIAPAKKDPKLDTQFQKAVDEQVNLLKTQMGQGVERGGLIRNDMGEVVDRFGNMSNNPKWYQDFYAQNGKKPSNAELRQIAERQLNEGYQDGTANIPAWDKQKVSEIDEELAILHQLRDETGDPNLAPLIDELEQQKRSLSGLKAGRDFEPALAGKDPGLIKVKPMPDIDHATGDVSSFRSKINRTPQKENKLMETLKNLRTQFVDDMAPLERLEKGIRGAIPSAENSLYKTARLIKGSPERAHEIVRTKLGPVLQSVKHLGFNEKDLGDYALAVHARDVNLKGMNSGFTNAEIEDVIKKFGTPEMEQERKQLVQVSDDVLRNELGENQILTSESMDAMRQKWPNYMPLFRAFDDDKVGFAGGMSNALANASNPIKRLEGSSRDVIDPIESMVKNIFQATNQADRNKVGLQLSKLAAEDQNGMLRKLNPSEKVDRKNVVSVMENGEKVKYEVPPEIYKTITNMDKESTNTLIKILQAPASTLRAGATLTPEFSLRNPLRDVVQAYVVSKSGFNPITDFPIGLWNAIFKGKTFKVGGREISSGKWFNDFIESNGGYGNIVSMDRNLHRKALENVLKEGDTPKFRNIVNPKSWLDVLRTIADVSETATKIGEYRAAIKKQGVTREEAAYRARDLMDFARAGTSIREANKVVAFLNANIQGKSKLIRAIKEDPKGVTARSFKAVTAPTIGAYIAQKYMSNDDQKATIDDAPQWMKDTFYLVPVPGTNQVARIPKPFDLAPIFSNLVERSLDFAIEKDPDAFDKYAKQAISSYSVPTMLTGLSPIIEGMANYSFFRQGPIDPMRDQDVKFPDRYDINTSETAKLLGKGVNTLTGGEGAFKNFGSPRIIDNTIRGLTGGLGEYTVDAVDFVMDKTGIVSKEAEKPDKQVNQQPLLRSFMVNKASTGESVNKLYNLLDTLTKARGSAKQNEKEFPKELLYKQVKDVTKDISSISKEMRAIENDKKLSGAEKRKQLDKLNKQRNEIARQAAGGLK